ncbi:MAG: HAD-IA family hydrolase, partial [Lachnospiraceae bacterium]|nr:HAD-IA family hydrolase [Lachnospiraceae bacterium]
MIKNLIFDIDGTLWNSTEIVAAGWQKAVDETGYSKCKITGKKLKKEFGLPMNVIADHVFSDLNDEAKKAELLELCCKYEHELLESNTKDISFPGIVDEIKKLSENYNLYIVSNCQKGYIELVMKRLGIESYIKGHLCFGDTGLTKGETMKKLMEANSLIDSETVYVGDTATDKEATNFAGATFLYAGYGFGDLKKEPYEAKKPADISKVLEKMNREPAPKSSVKTKILTVSTIVLGALLVICLGLGFGYYWYSNKIHNEKLAEMKADYLLLEEEYQTLGYKNDSLSAELESANADIENLNKDNEELHKDLDIQASNLEKCEEELDEYNKEIAERIKAEEDRIAALSDEEKEAESDVKEYNEMVMELRATDETYAELYTDVVKYLVKDKLSDKERKDLIKKYEKMLSIQAEYKKAK